MTDTIPKGFLPCRDDNSFNDVVSTMYQKVADDGMPVFGLKVEKKHCNFVGFCHGGAIMTFLDIALSSMVCSKFGQYTSTPTINLSFDFMSIIKEGDFIFTELHAIKLTRTMGFVSVMVEGPRGSVVRASGSFKLPRDTDNLMGMGVDDYHAWRVSDPADD